MFNMDSYFKKIPQSELFAFCIFYLQWKHFFDTWYQNWNIHPPPLLLGDKNKLSVFHTLEHCTLQPYNTPARTFESES
jgi:hypothetical protein